MISLEDAARIHYGRASYSQIVNKPAPKPKPEPLTDETILAAVEQVTEYFKKKEQKELETREFESRKEEEQREKDKKEQERLDEITGAGNMAAVIAATCG